MGRSMQSNLIGGQAIGSLPAGLTLQEKKDILQATPMSPALSLLGSLGVVRPAHSCYQGQCYFVLRSSACTLAWW